MNCDYVLAVKINERAENSLSVQQILTKHGCEIRARLGLPQQDMSSCTDVGLLILQICSDDKTMDNMTAELNGIPSVKAKYMSM
jgi:hypothetical protein